MKILNATKKRLVFQLDNGQMLTVHPGELSGPFIGTKILVSCIVASGSSEEIGIIVTSSYELDLLNKVPAAFSYLYNSDKEAKEKLLEGKDFSEPEVDGSVEVAKLRYELNEKISEIKSLNDKILSLSNSSAELDKLRVTVSDKLTEISKLNDTINELNSKLDQSESEKKDYENSVASLKSQLDLKSQEVLDLNNKIVNSAVNDDKELNEKISNYESELSKLKSELSDKTNEITNMESDAKSLMERYDKAKSAVTEICDKFGISYKDGEWVKNPE